MLHKKIPYPGNTNCLAELLRTTFLEASYLGIELVINQGYVGTLDTPDLAGILAATLGLVLSLFPEDKNMVGKKNGVRYKDG